jgi:hypothetical protein
LWVPECKSKIKPRQINLFFFHQQIVSLQSKGYPQGAPLQNIF